MVEVVDVGWTVDVDADVEYTAFAVGGLRTAAGGGMAINDPDLRPNGGGQIQYRKAASHSLFFSMN